MMYPWQENQWRQLWLAKQSNRLPHALLLTGDMGLGKFEFAKTFTQALLCKQAKDNGKPCGFCHDCTLLKAGTHPNLSIIEPEKPGHAIKVDQIRAASDFIYQSSLQGKYRVTVIHPAHSLNVNAANALLKTLEEPPEGAIVMLATEQYGYLPATVMSRCQRIMFTKPNEEQALQWLEDKNLETDMPLPQLLKLANGAPLLAARLHHEKWLPVRDDVFQGLRNVCDTTATPLELASKWQSLDLLNWMELTSSWIVDIIRLKLGATTNQITNQDHEGVLQSIAKKLSLQTNIQALDNLQRMRKQLKTGIHFNKQLAMENVLINWARAA